MKLKVGQELWWVPSYDMKPYSVTIKKVGRKWAELNNHPRININTLEADGGHYASPGRCYLSKQDYDDVQDILLALTQIRHALGGKNINTSGMTMADIAQARKLLRL